MKFISRARSNISKSFCGPTAWILLMLLAAIHVIALWDRWEKSYLIGSLILAATVPCLIAGYFASEAANASALRWGFAIVVSAHFRGDLVQRAIV